MTRIGFAPAVCAGLMLLLASPAARPGDPAAGKKVFVANCAGCHGMEGTAVLVYAPSFARGETLDKDDAVLIVSVRDGIYRMPPLGGYLTESEIADAIAYARTLSNRELRRDGSCAAPVQDVHPACDPRSAHRRMVFRSNGRMGRSLGRDRAQLYDNM